MMPTGRLQIPEQGSFFRRYTVPVPGRQMKNDLDFQKLSVFR